MSTPILARPSGNGHAHPGPCPVPLLAAKVDQLDRLRTRLGDLQAAERELTDELLAAMTAHGLARLAGLWTVATVDEETTAVPLSALSPATRRALDLADVHPEDLVAFCVPMTRPGLRLEPTRPAVTS